MKIIFIAGSSCTGKTTVSSLVASKLNGFLIPTDIIKYTIRSERILKGNDLIFENTFSAYRRYSFYLPEIMYEYAIKHSRDIVKSLKYIVDYFSNIYDFIVVEGAHLIPELLIENGLDKPNCYYFILDVDMPTHLSRLRKRGALEKTHKHSEEIIDFQKTLIENSTKLSQSYKCNNLIARIAARKIIKKVTYD